MLFICNFVVVHLYMYLHNYKLTTHNKITHEEQQQEADQST